MVVLMSDRDGLGERDHQYVSFMATYCENCGQLHDASDAIAEHVDEPVHRIDILEALGGIERPKVNETVATEERECECTGQVVKRYYAVGDVPDPDVDPPDDAYTGRDPREDGLIDFGPVGGQWEEVREVTWLEEGSDT